MQDDASVVKVGDVVAWCDVPDGALVRDDQGEYAIKTHDWAFWVGLRHQGASARESKWYPATQERWNPAQVRGQITIIAMGLTGSESADDLRRLAEIFEVREVLVNMIDVDGLWRLETDPPSVYLHFSHDQEITIAELLADDATEADVLQATAERLHAAGWRPGMTADDAARMLSASSG